MEPIRVAGFPSGGAKRNNKERYMAKVEDIEEYARLGIPVPGTILTPIERVDIGKYSSQTWKFLCKCGTLRDIRVSSVQKPTKSCGCKGNGRHKHLYDEENQLKQCSFDYCRRKGEWLELSEFSPRKRGLGSCDRVCKECHNIESIVSKRSFSNIEDYFSFIKEHNSECGICGMKLYVYSNHKKGDKDYVCIDHCHITGRNIGILCNVHNKGLGCFQESIELLEKAITYLKKHQKQSKN